MGIPKVEEGKAGEKRGPTLTAEPPTQTEAKELDMEIIDLCSRLKKEEERRKTIYKKSKYPSRIGRAEDVRGGNAKQKRSRSAQSLKKTVGKPSTSRSRKTGRISYEKTQQVLPLQQKKGV